ncbi:hypothetical protein CC1G_12711 [Coprinopsis cinerea okayama7|uniref:Uncharacterized protein n=1 Tax=Coprinopsis cinerea (strain Okayama-7 / 130 / ATCC MYA-4618 / FGSC 9003) TaxID=240176 RepID=A8PGY1_COPC7|nr:hypothetical protein CC1G_12711 [Coprinopsis cinerea okayama7\|eukprot:XP_001841304.1 hypothetical protein CC1G_12711 [Coprinopsis cinerea okayama7\
MTPLEAQVADSILAILQLGLEIQEQHRLYLMCRHSAMLFQRLEAEQKQNVENLRQEAARLQGEVGNGVPVCLEAADLVGDDRDMLGMQGIAHAQEARKATLKQLTQTLLETAARLKKEVEREHETEGDGYAVDRPIELDNEGRQTRGGRMVDEPIIIE